MSETGLAIRKDTNIVHSFAEAQSAAAAMSKSGYFQDSREASQALVKILAGQEMGFGPFSSMVGINIIQGKPAVGANLMAAAVKSSGRYDYRVKVMSETMCEIVFYQGKDEIGVSKFTIEDARKAGTKNLDKFPRNMLFARAISNGVKWYTPDVFNGAPVYTPEELGATVDGEGNVIDATFKDVPVEPKPELEQPKVTYQPAAPKTAVQDEPKAEYGPMTYEQACAVKGSKGEAYGTLTDLELKGKRFGITKIANDANTDATKQSAALNKLEAIKVLLTVPESERLERAGQLKLSQADPA